MGKGIGAHHGFVGLNHKTRGLTDHATGRQNMFGVYAKLKLEIVFAGFDRHDKFFQRAIACPLSQAVDGALDLPSTSNLYTSQRIGHSHTQIVVAMHRPNGFVGVRYALS